MSNKTVKISEKNYNKLHDIKDIQGFKSIDQVMDNILPEGSITKNDFVCESPAFTIQDNIVSWNDLKNEEIGKVWQSNDKQEDATLMFKDDYGALIRFRVYDDFFIEYYHFL